MVGCSKTTNSDRCYNIFYLDSYHRSLFHLKKKSHFFSIHLRMGFSPHPAFYPALHLKQTTDTLGNFFSDICFKIAEKCRYFYTDVSKLTLKLNNN